VTQPQTIMEASTTVQPNTTARFNATRWGTVLLAARQNEAGAAEAVEKVCSRYWYPLYAFLRRQGRTPEDAQDLTQGFLSEVLAKDRLEGVNPEKGKFRSFLLASLQNYVSNERSKEQAQKRGGGAIPVSIDFTDAEGNYILEPADARDPAALFNRRWAEALIGQVLDNLKQQYWQEGKAELFEKLHPLLTGEAGHGATGGAAAALGMSEAAVRQAVSRMRKAFRELLRQEIALTVESAEEIEEEIRNLFSAAQG
jgi:DNA-directed RNA polymerase specialized sigma24 family protein